MHPNELKAGGEFDPALSVSGGVNGGEIEGLVSVSVASGKGGGLVLEPTDCARSWRKWKGQNENSGVKGDGDGQVGDIITNLLAFRVGEGERRGESGLE